MLNLWYKLLFCLGVILMLISIFVQISAIIWFLRYASSIDDFLLCCFVGCLGIFGGDFGRHLYRDYQMYV